MTNRDINKLRRVLEANVVEFAGTVSHRDAIAIEGAANLIDREIQASERELAARSLDTAFTKRREARAALGRMQQGTYGVCLDCEEAISPMRLAALPWAARCVRCQKAVDFHGTKTNPQPTFARAA